MSSRRVGLFLHTDREAVAAISDELVSVLRGRGIEVAVIDPAGDLPTGLDLVVVLGGDGTMLRAAELVHGQRLPILGINLGRVGFLAEAERADLQEIAEWVASGSWQLERRITLDVQSGGPGGTWSSFALNEVAIEKSDRAMMTELRVVIDGSPVMAWAGDGLIVSTPTGSTAYAFSSGGPVIWPTADVIEVVPISAHALFARPLVLSPQTVVEVEVLEGPAIATCDGRRVFDLVEGDRLRIVRGAEEVVFARLHPTTFTNRLVHKFRLPTSGWRAQRDSDA